MATMLAKKDKYMTVTPILPHLCHNFDVN